MTDPQVFPLQKDLRDQAELTLRRLQPQLAAQWDRQNVREEERQVFQDRIEHYFPRFFSLLYSLYGQHYDFFYHLQQIYLELALAFHERPASLHVVDHYRLNHPDWHLSEKLVGGALYVDLFSENLANLRGNINYFQSLGFTYLHLMPLFAVRPGDNDGGYAISNYRSVDPRLGSMDDLRDLATDLREAGIVLVLDLVLNHTADDHEWAQRAQAGDIEYEGYYRIFPDRTLPDQYEKTLREIFPTVRRGNFTWHEGMSKWIWTTFNSFQWDLNYANPAVFCAVMKEMFFIVNKGVDILRFDAVPFIWKELGTNCENLPKAHTLVQAFNLAARISTPGLMFKSEAIVHPDEVVKYVSKYECQISYNPTLMALQWESLATRSVKLLNQSLSHRHKLPTLTTWVNYLRCHDDIGWTFDDEDARKVGINAYDHRNFLNRFYTGQFPGSFARGVPFQQNVVTGDMRISGTLASLAGLEQALDLKDEFLIEMACRRIILLNAIALSVGGIPLIYLGEEWGVLNDYDFVKDPAKSNDSRWIHRSKFQWDYFHQLETGDSIRKRLFTSLQQLIQLRKQTPAMAGLEMELLGTDNEHVLGFVRLHEGHRLIVLANFTEQSQEVDGNKLRMRGLGRFFRDLVTNEEISTARSLTLDAYRYMWLVAT